MHVSLNVLCAIGRRMLLESEWTGDCLPNYFSSVAYAAVPSAHDMYSSCAMAAHLSWFTAVREDVDLHVGLKLVEDITIQGQAQAHGLGWHF